MGYTVSLPRKNEQKSPVICALAARAAVARVRFSTPMKTLRFLTTFVIVSAFAAPFALAAETKKEEKSTPKGCDCEKDKNGKVCGVDKDCCCTGKKCDKPAEKKG